MSPSVSEPPGSAPAEPLRLSEIIGRPVCYLDGSPAGRIGDLIVRLGEGVAVVVRLLLAQHEGLVPWEAVRSFGAGRAPVVIAGPPGMTTPSTRTPSALASDELLLGRDVLDTQIVDVDGHRLVRVGDVRISWLEDGRPAAVAVDVGFGAVVRRLGLRRIARWWRPDAVAWEGLHLTSSRGHTVQLSTTSARVHHMDGAELARLVKRMPVTSAAEVLGTIDPGRAAAAIVASEPRVRHRLIRALPRRHAVRLLDIVPDESAVPLQRARAAALPERRFRRHRPHRRQQRRPGSPPPPTPQAGG